MRRAGLCSVTFRTLSATSVVRAAAAAGLEGVEWAQDAHVRLGDLDGARRVADATAAAGLVVTSFGSSFRAGAAAPDTEHGVWQQVLATATALGAPRIRVWAGRAGSAETSRAERTAVLQSLRHCVASTRLLVATEFHADTLTDDPGSARAMLAAVPGLRTYWQPPNGMPDDEAVAGLEAVLDRLAAVHVFSWWPSPAERRPLGYREPLWRRVAEVLAQVPEPLDLLLEFVPDDDPAVLAREAATLRRYAAAAAGGTG